MASSSAINLSTSAKRLAFRAAASSLCFLATARSRCFCRLASFFFSSICSLQPVCVVPCVCVRHVCVPCVYRVQHVCVRGMCVCGMCVCSMCVCVACECVACVCVQHDRSPLVTGHAVRGELLLVFDAQQVARVPLRQPPRLALRPPGAASTQHNARQGKARQGKARQDNTRRGRGDGNVS